MTAPNLKGSRALRAATPAAGLSRPPPTLGTNDFPGVRHQSRWGWFQLISLGGDRGLAQIEQGSRLSRISLLWPASLRWLYSAVVPIGDSNCGRVRSLRPVGWAGIDCRSRSQSHRGEWWRHRVCGGGWTGRSTIGNPHARASPQRCDPVPDVPCWPRWFGPCANLCRRGVPQPPGAGPPGC